MSETPSDRLEPGSAAPKRFPVTDDLVWCGTCENYHLPNQHDDHVDQGSAATLDDDPRYFPTQADVLAWVARRWPERTSPIWRAAKLNEEAGEVIGAVIKEDEGRKTAEDIAQETAQAVICCMALAEAVGFDLWAEVAREFGRCQP